MKKRSSVLISVLFFFSTGTAFSGVINVPGDYPTIQQAINAAVPGETVLVGEGLYVENLTLRPRIVLKSAAGPQNTVIEGGFQNHTILCAEGGEVDGFSVIGSGSPNTAGIKIDACTMTVRNCTIRNNYFGIRATESSSRIEGNWIHSNDTGISASGSSLTIEGNVVEDNNWTNIVLGSTSSSHENSTLRGNSLRLVSQFDSENLKIVGPNGEASPLIVRNEFIAVTNVNPSYHIRVFDGKPSVRNNVFYKGRYGIYLNHFEAASVFGNIFYRTRYPMDGIGTLFFEEDYNNFFDNPGGLSYDGFHDIDQDPLFVDADNRDFRLQAGSACIDTGDPASDVPIDGGDRSDIGAYEYPINFNDSVLAFLDDGESDSDRDLGTVPPVRTIHFELSNPFPTAVTVHVWFDRVSRETTETFFVKRVLLSPESTFEAEVNVPPARSGSYTVRGMVGLKGAIVLDAENISTVEEVRTVLPRREVSRTPVQSRPLSPQFKPANGSGD